MSTSAQSRVTDSRNYEQTFERISDVNKLLETCDANIKIQLLCHSAPRLGPSIISTNILLLLFSVVRLIAPDVYVRIQNALPEATQKARRMLAHTLHMESQHAGIMRQKKGKELFP